MRLLLLVFLSVLLGSCNSYMQLDSGPLVVAATQAPYHWTATSFPIPIYVNPNMNPDRQVGVVLAAQLWNDLVGDAVFTVVSDPPPGFLMFAENGSFSILGCISVEDGILGLNADGIQVNAYAEVALRPGRYELLGEMHSSRVVIGIHVDTVEASTVIAFHELGHSLGLAHDGNDRTSIMWYSATLSSTQHLQAEDLAYVRSQVYSVF